jgi:Uma2 family endonuclease
MATEIPRARRLFSARTGIREYWIVDLDGRVVETFRTPIVFPVSELFA